MPKYDFCIDLPDTTGLQSVNKQMLPGPGGIYKYGWQVHIHASIENPPTYLASDGQTYRMSYLSAHGAGMTVEEAVTKAWENFCDRVAKEPAMIEQNIRNKALLATTKAKAAATTIQLSIEDLDL